MFLVLALAGTVGLTGAAAQHESGPVGVAKNLYGAARYDDALELLNALRDGAADRKAVEKYRSLCLLALGRPDEAEHAIAAVVSTDPTYRPDETEASPRVRATFADVRRRLLPQLATDRYAQAKAAYDRRDWAPAIEQLQLVLSLVNDPDMAGRLPDLRLLASGFLELATHASSSPAPAAPAADGPGAGNDVVESVPGPRAPDPARVYGADDTDVVPPVIQRQDLPKVPSAIAAATAPGVLEVLVDAQGRVTGLTVRQSVHPAYDRLLLSTAQGWKYEPARLDGRPVRYRKLIQIVPSR